MQRPRWARYPIVGHIILVAISAYFVVDVACVGLAITVAILRGAGREIALVEHTVAVAVFGGSAVRYIARPTPTVLLLAAAKVTLG